MPVVEIKMNLSDDLAHAAGLFGLLTPESIEAMLRAEIERLLRADIAEAIQQVVEDLERDEGVPARVSMEAIREMVKDLKRGEELPGLVDLGELRGH